ncbi:hypothetical protein STENM223S_06489 [Streptomyces tendae]
MVEGGDASAEGRQDGGPQPVVLDDEGVQLARCASAVVAVPDLDGQQAAQWLVVDLAGHVARQVRPVPVVYAVGLVQGAQRRQGVVRPQRRRGQGQYLASDRRHGCPWKPLPGVVNRGSVGRGGATCLTFKPVGGGAGGGLGSGGSAGTEAKESGT